MKKLSLGIIIIFASYIILSLSCASSKKVTPKTTSNNIVSSTESKPVEKKPEKKVVFDVTYDYETENPDVTIRVTPVLIGSFYDYFICSFKNNTSKIAKIVWQGSSICYNNDSYLLFIEGQKYTDAKSNPMPATPIPKDGTVRKTVNSSEQAYYSNGKWSTLPIIIIPTISETLQLIFQIESENGTEYVTVNVRYHYEES